jgi:hypothetical protein
MRRDTIKLLVFAGIVGFAVLYGMELSSKGIEDVNGPWSGQNRVTEQEASMDEEWTLPAPTRETVQGGRTRPVVTAKPTADTSPYSDWEEEEYGIPRNDRTPLVDRVSGKTAEVLHDLSREGIRMVVSLFDKVTG